MTSFIEPNLHPLVVHFVIAFLMTGPGLLLIAALSPSQAAWRSGIQSAGDWMLALGLLAVLAAIGAGLQAYYTVQHDGLSHAAMTDHRNWAFVTAALLLLFGGWRYVKRNSVPSVLFAALLLIPVVLLGITSWKGGHLVYYYGIGVTSLPEVTGDGHDHDHGGAELRGHDNGIPADHQGETESPLRASGNGHDHDHGIPDDHDGTDEVESLPEPDAETLDRGREAEHDHSTHDH